MFLEDLVAGAGGVFGNIGFANFLEGAHAGLSNFFVMLAGFLTTEKLTADTFGFINKENDDVEGSFFAVTVGGAEGIKFFMKAFETLYLDLSSREAVDDSSVGVAGVEEFI